jgi:DNA-binding GntR family transcriptional regulator
VNATPNPLRRQIRDALVARIKAGELEPGDRLVEMRLAREFETSQAPVREALRELATLGYVTATAHRGTHVREVPATELRDALHVRAILEREAAGTAARAGGDWRALRTSLGGIAESARTGDVARYVRHDEAFHRGLVERTGNPVLLGVWTRLLVATHPLALYRSSVVDLTRTGREHRWILEALERGDAECAARRVFEHIEGVAAAVDATLH